MKIKTKFESIKMNAFKNENTHDVDEPAVYAINSIKDYQLFFNQLKEISFAHSFT